MADGVQQYNKNPQKKLIRMWFLPQRTILYLKHLEHFEGLQQLTYNQNLLLAVTQFQYN